MSSRGGGTVFGHKSSNKTTVGTATVQSPSMLDNVSTQDFGAGGSAEDIQQRVQDALTQNEMKKMEIVEPASGGFMASPMPPVASVSGSIQDVSASSAPSSPPPVSAQEPFNVASLEAAENPQPPQPEQDSSIPRPLTPEEDKQAVIDAENMPTPLPTPAPISSAPAEAPPVVSAVTPLTTTDETTAPATAESDPISDPVASDSVESTAAISPSAPIDPPAAPPLVQDDTTTNDTTTADDEEVEESPEVETESETETEAKAETEISEESSVAPVASDDSSVNEPEPESAESSSDTSPEAPESDASPTSMGIPAIDTSKLAALKQHALDHLEPLVDGLDQSPEEEFRTTMMRIQANDNHTLLEKALNAAKKIDDGNARAKALLDIINEINYFAQVSEISEEPE